MNRTPLTALLAACILIATGALHTAQAQSGPGGKYDLSGKKSIRYSVDPLSEPDLFIALELLFHGALRGEPGVITEFCLLIKKIANDDNSTLGFGMDLGFIITIRGDEDFAGELADIALSKKEKQRIWGYLAAHVDPSKYPATRKALLGK